MNPTLVDLIDDWLFDRFGARWKLLQNKVYPHLWGISNLQNVVVVRIDTEKNTIGCGDTILSFYDPDFFVKLERLIK
jgi:hypothetical protein